MISLPTSANSATPKPRVVQAGDGNEGAGNLSRHDRVDGGHHGTHDRCSGFVDSGESRGVAPVQQSSAGARCVEDKLDVIVVVKQFDGLPVGLDGFSVPRAVLETSSAEFLDEGRVPLRAERVVCPEVVTGERLARVDPNS